MGGFASMPAFASRWNSAEQVIDSLAPGGVLVTGAREGVDHVRLGLRPVAPFVPGVYVGPVNR